MVAEPHPRLTVLDWEMSRRGNGATDVGQFAAEAWLLDTHRGRRGLLAAFLDAYATEAGKQHRITAAFAKRVAVHMGTHLAYWPSMVDWADDKGTRDILIFGRDMVVGAETGDLEWIRSSVLKGLVAAL